MKRAAGAIVPPFTELAGSDANPLFRQIYTRLRDAVLDGTLPGGHRLPSARTLAGDLGVSRNTVEAAFSQLVAEGFVTRRVGAGSYVARAVPEPDRRPRRPRGAPNAAARTAVPAPPPALSARGRLLATAGAGVEAASPRVFAPCVPSLEDFPVQTWNRLVARRARRAGHELLSKADPAGYRPLREAVAAHLGAARGVRCEWRQVVVLTSTQQAMDLAARLALDPGDQAWIEDPGYLGARAALRAAGAQTVPVPVDAEGLDVSAGEALAPRARLAYVTPSHQYPLGATLSLARRLQLLNWAGRAGAWILEDDYDSEFRFAGRPLAAVQGLDTEGRVLYAGTFNKVMFPSLRLAYLVVPPALVDAFVAARALSDGCPPALTQAALADFIEQGHFAAHVRRMRAIYQERRDALRESAERHLAGA